MTPPPDRMVPYVIEQKKPVGRWTFAAHHTSRDPPDVVKRFWEIKLQVGWTGAMVRVKKAKGGQ